jgi:hypothetical protein
VIDQLAAGETLHDTPTPVTDDSDPPVLLGWNATVLFDETIPEQRGGIVEFEVKTRAFKRFAVYLIDTSAAKLTAINAALQAQAPYYGEVTQGIPATNATRDALATDAEGWRDEATAAGKDGLAAKIEQFRLDVLAMTSRADFLRAMRDVLGITNADIDRVSIGQPEE